MPRQRTIKFTLLIDESGSMSDSSKKEPVLQALVLFSEVLSNLGIDFSIRGFGSSTHLHKSFSNQFIEDVPNSYFSPEERDEIIAEVDSLLGGAGCTNDSLGLRSALSDIEEYGGEDNIVIVLTDGEGNGEEKLEDVLAELESNSYMAGNRPVKVIGVGIGSGCKYVEKTYPEQGRLIVPDVKDLPLYFKELLEGFIMGFVTDTGFRDRFVGLTKSSLLMESSVNAYLVGGDREDYKEEDFLAEVKGTIRGHFREEGKMLQFRLEKGRLIAELNTGTVLAGRAEFREIGLPFEAIYMREIFRELEDTDIKVLFLKDMNLLNYKDPNLYQIGRGSNKRRQIYLPANLLYLLPFTSDPTGVLTHLIKHEECHILHPELTEQEVKDRTKEFGNSDEFKKIMYLASILEYLTGKVCGGSRYEIDFTNGLIKNKRGDVVLNFDLDAPSIEEAGKDLFSLLKNITQITGNIIIPQYLNKEAIREIILGYLIEAKMDMQSEPVELPSSDTDDSILLISSNLIVSDIAVDASTVKFKKLKGDASKAISRAGLFYKKIYIVNETTLSESEFETLLRIGYGIDFIKNRVSIIPADTVCRYDTANTLLITANETEIDVRKCPLMKYIKGDTATPLGYLLLVGTYRLLERTNPEIVLALKQLGYTEIEIKEIEHSNWSLLPPPASLAAEYKLLPLLNQYIDRSA